MELHLFERCDSSWVGNQHCMQWSETSRICFLFCSLTCSSLFILYLVRTVCSLSGTGVIDRLSITSGNTTPYFQASSTFPIYISWLWCTPVMYTMICLVVVCSCYHGLAINSLYIILWTYHLPAILTSGAYFLCTCARLYKCTHHITAHMSSLIRIPW